MTDEEQNIAIAEFCGYRHDICNVGPMGTKREGYWRPNGNFSEGIWHIPKYTSDLNAIHDAEKKLSKLDKPWSSNSSEYATVRYTNELYEILNISMRKETVVSNIKQPDGSPLLLNTTMIANPFEPFKMFTATAAQKAEALLKAIGKWKYE